MLRYSPPSRCGPRSRSAPSTIVADARARRSGAGISDPTGTLPLQRRWTRDLDSRWVQLRRLIPDAVSRASSKIDMISHAALTGEDPTRAFQSWIDEAMRQLVLGINGTWTLPYVRGAGDIALHRSAVLISARDSVQDGDPDQPRDDHGRWSATEGVPDEPGTTLTGDAGPDDEARDDHGRWTSGGGATDTPEFKSWFSGSKVTDANDKPQIVYHGSQTEFDEFAPERVGTNSNVLGSWQSTRSGIFFAEDPDLANEYATQAGVTTGANIKPVYLSIKDPIDLTKGFSEAQLNGLEAAGFSSKYYSNLSPTNMWEAFDHENGGKDFVAYLKKEGYDGATIVEKSSGDVNNTRSWVAFDPEQVKSATGNKGTFDPKSAKLRDAAPPVDRIPLLQSLTVAELQGIEEAVSQQAVRAFAQGALIKQSTSVIARSIQRVIDDVGVARGRLLVSFMTVRAFSAATLDAFRAAGITSVGVAAERAGPRVSATPRDGLARDAKKSTKPSGSGLEGLVEVLTAGDDDVCPQCEQISEDGPYDVDEAESLIPAHPRCRCAFVPWNDERFADVGDAFNEEDHPRADNGEFTEAGGNEGDKWSNANESKPTVFYKGHNPGDERRIKTGNDTWDSHLFVSSKKERALDYGSSLEEFKAKPGAKILYEGTREFTKVAGKWRKNENLLQYASRAANAAKAAGYDATWFMRQGDVGTAIHNPDAFIKRKYTGDAFDPDQPRDDHGRWTSISTVEAEETFSDYDHGALVKSASGGARAKAGDMAGGAEISHDDAGRINATADHLQRLASISTSKNKEVWRGVAMPKGTNVRAMFPHNKMLSFDTLTATSGQRSVAEKYADPQFIGEDEGERVLLRIGAKHGVTGHDSQTGELAGAETILPAGAKYRISGYRREGDTHVFNLYHSGKTQTKDEFNPDQHRDDHGRWASVGGLKSWTSPSDNAWADVSGQNHDINEPPLPNLKPGYSFVDKTTGKQVNVEGQRLSSGVVIREPDGRAWLVKPRGGYGGYRYTWPKGGVEEGLHPQANAIKEAYEETGLKVRITGYAGDYHGDTSVTRMYHAVRESGHPRDHGWETESVTLVHPGEAHKFLNRSRDRKIAEHHLGDAALRDDFDPDLHPRDKEGKFTFAGSGALDMKNLVKVSGKMGSNEGGVYKDVFSEKQYYVKTPPSKDHVTNELLAAKLYQLAGAKTLNYVPVAGGAHVATQMEDLAKKNVKDLNQTERQAAQSDFAVHAWLANWDAAGTGGDNVGVRANGDVLTLDTGGSLKYRAQGEPKGAAFGDKVTETNTLRDPSKSPDAAKLFGNMTNDQIKESIARVTSINSNDIAATVLKNGGDHDMITKLIQRKYDLAAQAEKMSSSVVTPPLAQENIVAKTATTPPTPAPDPIKSQLLLVKGSAAERVAWRKQLKETTDPAARKLLQAKVLASFLKAHGKASDPSTKSDLATKLAQYSKQYKFPNPLTAPATPAPSPYTPTPAYQSPSPSPASPSLSPATTAELEKAKKSAPLQVQYVPGAPQGHPDAQKLVDKFNEKYAGQTLSQEQLHQKVADFKKLQSDMIPLQSEMQKNAAAVAAKAKAESDAKIAKEKAELEAKMNDPEVKAHYEVLAGIGVGKPSPGMAQLIAKNNLKITPEQGMYIRAYVGSHYGPVNDQLRKGVLTLQQAKYAEALNEALDKMPIYAGDVERGASLSPEALAKYQKAVGSVVIEHQFTSAGVKNKLWGSTSFHIKSKRARDIRSFNPGEGGGEVVFKSGSKFHVTKVVGNSIWMEEI